MTGVFGQSQTQSTPWVGINDNTIQRSPPLSLLATHVLRLRLQLPLPSCFTSFSRFQTPSQVFLSPFDVNGKGLLPLRIFSLHVDLLSICAPPNEKSLVIVYQWRSFWTCVLYVLPLKRSLPLWTCNSLIVLLPLNLLWSYHLVQAICQW